MKLHRVQSLRFMRFKQLLLAEPSLQETDKNLENACAICTVEFREDEEVCTLDCKSPHAFHNQCLERWLNLGRRKCPICRAKIQINRLSFL